jgi:hypothetical protein
VVDGGEGNNDGTKARKDANKDKEIIDRDRAVEWEDFNANIWRMLPHPQCFQQWWQ